jgi:Cu-Zn family superoxide dismutase
MKPIRMAAACAILFSAACGGNQPPAPNSTPIAETPAPTAAPPESASAPPALESAMPEEKPAPPPPKTITVELLAKSGSKLKGTATFTEQSDGVKISIHVEGLKPGDHGAHVHEKPDCSAPDAKSAGGHYNPDQHDHALPPKDQRHLGDLGNMTVDKDGKGSLEIVIPGANLKAGDPHSFLDRSVVIHEKKDDGGQPVGNAGGRVGCGEIKDKT